MDEPISDESGMTGFFVFGSPLLVLPTPIDLPNKRVHLKGLYPLYPGEAAIFKERGMDWLWKDPRYDGFSVVRPDLSRESRPTTG